MIQEKSNNKLSNWELVSINPNNKIWNWKDLFCLWANSIQSVIGFSLIASLYLVYNLNIAVVFFIIEEYFLYASEDFIVWV